MRLFSEVFGKRFGFERSLVCIGGQPYLMRWILWFGWFGLRLHKFHRGDDLRAYHDHPWAFVTLPFTDYEEWRWDAEARRSERTTVPAFRLHYRPRGYRHIVIGRADGARAPFWSVVVTGPKADNWGFWPSPTTFVPWREWV